jgi:hypothetical protein
MGVTSCTIGLLAATGAAEADGMTAAVAADSRYGSNDAN